MATTTAFDVLNRKLLMIQIGILLMMGALVLIFALMPVAGHDRKLEADLQKWLTFELEKQAAQKSLESYPGELSTFESHKQELIDDLLYLTDAQLHAAGLHTNKELKTASK